MERTLRRRGRGHRQGDVHHTAQLRRGDSHASVRWRRGFRRRSRRWTRSQATSTSMRSGTSGSTGHLTMRATSQLCRWRCRWACDRRISGRSHSSSIRTMTSWRELSSTILRFTLTPTLSPVSCTGQALRGMIGVGIHQTVIPAKAGIHWLGVSFDKLRTNESSVYLPL